MQTTFEAPRSQLSVFVVALALLGALILGGASGYLLKSLQAQRSVTLAVPSAGSAVVPAVDSLTGYPSGSADDQRILALLKQSGYEGGATVVQAVDLITGYPSGSAEDQRILGTLKQSGYEGGATVVQGR